MAQASDAGLEELLSQQMQLIQQALAFNQQIAERLAKGGHEHLELTLPTPTRSSNASLRGEIFAQHKSKTLEEPLLPSQRQSEELPRQTTPGRSLWPPFGLARQTSTESGAAKTQDRPTLFPNPEDIKARVLRTLTRPVYNVEDHYKTDGVCQALARSSSFQNAALVLIFWNTLWIAYETDHNKAAILSDAPTPFIITDNVFCLFFTFEIAVRLFAFRNKLDAIRDAWFTFDATLVALMVWETWIVVALYQMGILRVHEGEPGAATVLRILRVFRIARVARIGRLLRVLPELMILVKAIGMAVRAVGTTLLLLVLIIYGFAVMFTQLLSANPDLCFQTVPQSMNCLLLHGVFPEEAEFITSLLDVDWIYYILILFYLLFASLTVLNMIIAVLCEVVAVVAKVEKEENQMKELKGQIFSMMEHIDVHGHDYIQRENFQQLIESPEALQSLDALGVDVVALVGYGDFIFRDSDRVPLTTFIETVLQFRGSNTATVKDVVDMRKCLSNELGNLEQKILKATKTQHAPETKVAHHVSR